MSDVAVDTGAVLHASTGIRHVAEQLSQVRVDTVIHALGAEVRLGSVEADAPNTANQWSALTRRILTDVELTAHSYEQSVALYEAVERRLLERAKAAGRDFVNALTGGPR